MKGMSIDMKEYGGYLPLELPYRKEFFDDIQDIVRVNCGRAAIYCALMDAKPNKVYIPFYNCEFVKEPFEKAGIKYDFYNIDEDFMPVNVNLLEDEYILWVNYFGIQASHTIEKVKIKYGNVIFDNTQAFFSPPVYEAYNIYSCRKFFGVSDGAYLIKNNIKQPNLEQDISYNRAQFMLKSIEKGTNAGYKGSMQNEDELAKNVYAMSRLTQRILCSIDYEDIKNKRYNNFIVLHRYLGEINELKVNTNTQTAMVYPLLIKDDNLRQKLVESKIYIPQWWKHVINKTDENSFDNYLSRYLIPLPIDQRYNQEDMKYIANLVMSFRE